MASYRTPGPLGLHLTTLNPGDGTSARVWSFQPGTIELRGANDATGLMFKRPTELAAWDAASALSRTEKAIIDAVQATMKLAAVGSMRYLLARAAQWPNLSRRGSYEVVETDDARQILLDLAGNSRTTPAEKVALKKASDLLAGTRNRIGDAGLLLLRVLHVRSRDSASSEPALTPSQLARLRERPAEPEQDHWIGIELCRADGTGVKGVKYRITTPDGKEFEGMTNEYGLAHIDGIKSAGQCRISFPELDKDLWAPS
jgi:hypothetical protein